MQKKVIAVAGILLILAVLVVFKFYTNAKPQTSEEVHYHAGFVVFKDKQKVDFSGAKYMTVKPCEIGEHNPTPEEIQLDKAHLHGGVGDVLHVHTKGAKWKDIFTNLDYAVDYSALNAYLNGREIEELAERSIEPYDSLVLFIGEEDVGFISDAVTRDRITEVEKNSVECGN